MPASMINDEAGGSENVNGSRIAIVVIGAMPGSTPTSVPISAPMKQKPRCAGLSAVAKPVARLAKRSMRGSRRSPSWRPDRDRQPEHGDEQHHRERGQRGRQNQVLPRTHVVGGKAGGDHDGEARQREPGDRQQNGEQ